MTGRDARTKYWYQIPGRTIRSVKVFNNDEDIKDIEDLKERIVNQTPDMDVTADFLEVYQANESGEMVKVHESTMLVHLANTKDRPLQVKVTKKLQVAKPFNRVLTIETFRARSG